MKINTKVIQIYTHDCGMWFRVFGKGLSIVNRTKRPPLFSARYGYTKELSIFNYGIQWLE